MKKTVTEPTTEMFYVFMPADKLEPWLFDPFTAEAAIGMIASLGSSYASGQQLKKLFENQLSDISGMIQAAVVRMDLIIHEAIDRQTIQECQAVIDGCRQLLVEFENAPTNDHRLQFAVTQSAVAIKTLIQLGWRQFEPYGDAASMRMLVLCVCVKTYLTKGDWDNLRAFADKSLVDLDAFIADADKYMQSLVAGVSEIQFKDTQGNERCHGKGDTSACFYWTTTTGYFTDNGVETWVGGRGSDENAAIERARSQITPQRAAALAKRQADALRVVTALKLNRDIRAAEWNKCCELAANFLSS